VHFERLEDVFVDVDFEVVAGEALDDLAEEDVTKVGVGPAVAGRESNVRVGQHGGDLGPAGGLEGLPVAVGGVVAVQGQVGLRKPAEWVSRWRMVIWSMGRSRSAPGAVRDVFHSGVVEREQAAVAQLQDGDGGEGLGDGGPVVGGLGVDGLRGLPAGLAEEELRGWRGAMDEGEATADYAVAGEGGFKAGLECGDLGVVTVAQRSGDGQSEGSLNMGR